MAKDKNAALGMNHATASVQLKKLLMFKMMRELGQDMCHRCGETIETADTLSVEHKKAWLSADDPLATFFDLDNVVFSHLSCNSRASTGNLVRWAGHDFEQTRLQRNARRREKRHQPT